MNSNAVYLKSVFEKSMIERGADAMASISQAEAVIVDIEELTRKILALPEYMQSLLYAKYIWNLESKASEEIFSVHHAKQKLQYAKSLLAYSLRLTDEQVITDHCMEQATQSAIDSYMKNIGSEVAIKKPQYSDEFKKQLKEIKAAQMNNKPLSLKRVGIAIIAAILSFAMTITVNADLREKFISWLVETFPLFSQFTSVGEVQPNRSDFERLRNMKLNYIPKGFTYISLFEAEPMLVYNYEDSSGKSLSINASLSTGSPILADTEDTQVSEIIFNGQLAYWWEKDGLCYFIWQQDGFELNIVGQISHEEAMKIAKNIQI